MKATIRSVIIRVTNLLHVTSQAVIEYGGEEPRQAAGAEDRGPPLAVQALSGSPGARSPAGCSFRPPYLVLPQHLEAQKWFSVPKGSVWGPFGCRGKQVPAKLTERMPL